MTFTHRNKAEVSLAWRFNSE